MSSIFKLGGQLQYNVYPTLPPSAIMTWTNPGAPGSCYDGSRGATHATFFTRRPGATSRVFSGATGVGVMDTLNISTTLTPTSVPSKYWAIIQVTQPSGTVTCTTTLSVSPGPEGFGIPQIWGHCSSERLCLHFPPAFLSSTLHLAVSVHLIASIGTLELRANMRVPLKGELAVQVLQSQRKHMIRGYLPERRGSSTMLWRVPPSQGLCRVLVVGCWLLLGSS